MDRSTPNKFNYETGQWGGLLGMVRNCKVNLPKKGFLFGSDKPKRSLFIN